MAVSEFLEKSPENREKSVFMSAEESYDIFLKLPESVLSKKARLGRGGSLDFKLSGKKF